MNLNFLYIWLGVMIIVTITAPIIREKRGLNSLDTEDFVVVGFALSGAIALFKVLLKVLTETQLQKDLDWDGTIALCISSVLGIYLSLKEVIKLFSVRK
jgi:lysylphosphatidylglycerol synthetase-like protein (DUF2156 family)